MKFTNITV